MVAMTAIVRITDQFCDRSNPDSIDRQGKLGQVTALVMIFYSVIGMAFIKFEELEKSHRRAIYDPPEVTFEFTAPPLEPAFKVREAPKPISLTEGQKANPGTAAAPKAAPTEAVT